MHTADAMVTHGAPGFEFGLGADFKARTRTCRVLGAVLDVEVEAAAAALDEAVEAVEGAAVEAVEGAAVVCCCNTGRVDEPRSGCS
jgi:hypothetical protein